MKTFLVRVLGACALLCAFAACGSLDLAPGGNPDRVLTGVVNAGTGLPQGAEIVVRVIATQLAPDSLRPANSDAPVMSHPRTQTTEQVLGEQSQKLAAGTSDPVPFRIEYVAEDDLLRKGLTVDVRVSYGGKLRYRTINAHVVTLASAPYRQEVVVQPVSP